MSNMTHDIMAWPQQPAKSMHDANPRRTRGCNATKATKQRRRVDDGLFDGWLYICEK